MSAGRPQWGTERRLQRFAGYSGAQVLACALRGDGLRRIRFTLKGVPVAWIIVLLLMTAERQSNFYDASPPQASRELAKLRSTSDYVAPFTVSRRRVIDDLHDGKTTIDATVVIRVGSSEETEAARGVGVVHALDVALRKALLKYFPYLSRVTVTETYTHASGNSTEAEVVSVKKFSDGQVNWSTLAKSANTVEAGWKSLVDGYEWRINRENRKARRMVNKSRLSQR